MTSMDPVMHANPSQHLGFSQQKLSHLSTEIHSISIDTSHSEDCLILNRSYAISLCYLPEHLSDTYVILNEDGNPA
ncbi:hypothetical protein Tco_0502091 [Tanacetum coccineum]